MPQATGFAAIFGLKNKLAMLIATFFAIGHIPFAPGTMGSLAALPLAILFLYIGIDALYWSTILITVVGLWAANHYSQWLGREDPSEVVIDEVAGMFLTLIGLVNGKNIIIAWQWSFAGWVLASFLLFRLFDITKPWPIRTLEKWPGGWGIMMDDLAAGILAGGILFALSTLS